MGVAVQAAGVAEGTTRVGAGRVAPAGAIVGVQVGNGDGEEVKVGIANRGSPDGRVGTSVATGNEVGSLPERPGRDASAGVLVGVGVLPVSSLVPSPLHTTTTISSPIVASARGSRHLRLDTVGRPSEPAGRDRRGCRETERAPLSLQFSATKGKWAGAGRTIQHTSIRRATSHRSPGY